MQKFKVAFFIDSLKENLDGVSNTSHRILERLEEANIEPLIFSPLPPESSSFKYSVFRVPSLTIPYANDYKMAVMGSKSRIFKQLDEFKPDFIHWSSPSLLGKYATEYAQLNSIPNLTIYHAHFSSYVNYIRGLPFKGVWASVLEKRIVNYYTKADLVLAPTLSMKEYLLSLPVPEEKVRIWGRGIDRRRFNEQFRDKTFLTQFGIEETDKVVLFVSRLVHYKETDLLIRLSHLLTEGIKMVITGDGPERIKLESECKSNTVFTGRLMGEALSKVYASSDLFVFPSRTDTFGNVILEAMSSGLPVIAANEGGPKNIIRHEETGFLVGAGDESVFNERILELFENQVVYERFRANAIEYAKSTSWHTLIGELFEYYRGEVRVTS